MQAYQYKDKEQFRERKLYLVPKPDRPKETTSEHKEVILNLCVAVIVADGKVRQIEIDTFIDILKACLDDPLFTLEPDYDFYEHAKYVQKIMNSPSKNFWLGIQHMRLRGYPHRRLLLDKLWRLSVSDSCLDSREATVIDFFARLWRES